MKSDWKVICLSLGSLSISKLLTVNQSKLYHFRAFQTKLLTKFLCRVSELLDYTAEELTGMSLYALCHGEDVHKLKSTHEDRKFCFYQ